jgi:transcriptional regulator with XRE-family HTH domain
MADATSRRRARKPAESPVAARQAALGDAIRRARGDITQAELASRVGVVQSAVSAWEAGDVDLTCEQVRAIEVALDVPIGTLLERAGFVSVAAWGAGAICVLEFTSQGEALEGVEAATTLGFSVRLATVWGDDLVRTWELHVVAAPLTEIAQL